MNEQQEFHNLLTRKLEELQNKTIKIEESFVFHNIQQKIDSEKNEEYHKEMKEKIKEIKQEIEPLVKGIEAFGLSKKFLLGLMIFIGTLIALIISLKELFKIWK